VGLVATILVRHKAVEIALTKLGLSEQDWNNALQEAVTSARDIPDSPMGEKPLENYLEEVTRLLKQS